MSRTQSPTMRIGTHRIGPEHPTFFISELGANHDGSLHRALNLIDQAARAGANAVKFQHYRADTLASARGFDKLDSLAHYTDNPHRVFKRYETPWAWTKELKEHCMDVGVEFLSTPYEIDAVDHLEPYVNAYKIGSGDITYIELIKHIASKGKPVILSCGASDFGDIFRALSVLRNVPVCILQCITNYDGSTEIYKHMNLRVITALQEVVPYAVIGLSDHAPGWEAVMGAVVLGARVIEKHFTDGKSTSPDNGMFATTPKQWSHMVSEVRNLEAALGDGIKKVEECERETVVLQRRCLRAARSLSAGTILDAGDLAALRPAPPRSVPPFRAPHFLGKRLLRDLEQGEEIRERDVVS